MTAETDTAARLLRSMQPILHNQTFVFVSIPAGCAIPKDMSPIMLFREVEGTTLIVEEAESNRTKIHGDFRCRMITLNVRSSLHAIGFLSAITARLATAGIAVNAVSAFHHDHVFVPVDRAEAAHRILAAFSDQN